MNPGGPAPEVWFGTELALLVNPLSTTQIVALTPPSAGQTSVEVTVIYPTGESCSVCCYTYIPGCYITSIVPDSGGTNGAYSLTITGWGFEPRVTLGGMGYCPAFSPIVRFDDVYADYLLYTIDPSGTQITVVPPPSYLGVPTDVKVTNVLFGTECTLVGGYEYLRPGAGPCSLVAVDPAEGWQQDFVTLRGDGFDGETEVLFANFPSRQVVYVSPQEIQVEVPCEYELDLSTGSAVVDVVVAPRSVDPCILSGGFTYVPPACADGDCPVTGVSPSVGPVSGTNTVTVTGTSFCDPSTQPGGFIEIWFGGVPGQVTFVDRYTLSVVVPPSATGTGPVDVIYTDATGCVDLCMGCYTYN